MRAVAQVQWGLRRWRQLAGRLDRGRRGSSTHSVLRTQSADPGRSSADTCDEDVIVQNLIPDGMRSAQEAAERALRVGVSPPMSAAVRVNGSKGSGCESSGANSVCNSAFAPGGSPFSAPRTASGASPLGVASAFQWMQRSGSNASSHMHNLHASFGAATSPQGSLGAAPPSLLTAPPPPPGVKARV